MGGCIDSNFKFSGESYLTVRKHQSNTENLFGTTDKTPLDLCFQDFNFFLNFRNLSENADEL